MEWEGILTAPPQVHQLRSSPNPAPGIFMEARWIKSLDTGDGFNLQPILCHPPPAPPPGGGSRVGLNIPTFLALGWFPWQPASILRGFPKSHLINISSEVFERACYMSNKRLLFISSLSFWNYLGTENKTKYYNKRCPYGS